MTLSKKEKKRKKDCRHLRPKLISNCMIAQNDEPLIKLLRITHITREQIFLKIVLHNRQFIAFSRHAQQA